jgi:hypothetical protein
LEEWMNFQNLQDVEIPYVVGENVKVIDGHSTDSTEQLKILEDKRKLKFLFLFSVEKLQWNLAICR